jgi:tRNA(fMet)-specific endonuclease VapC
MYLLDTNVCIQFLNRRSQKLIDRLVEIDPNEIFLCSIVKAELFYGAHKSSNPLKTLKVQKEFCNRFKSLPFEGQ